MNAVEEFGVDLERQVTERVEQEDGWYKRDAFVRIVADHLREDGSLEDIHVCYHLAQYGRSRIEVAGYYLSDEGHVLDLVAVDYPLGGQTILRNQVAQSLRWTRNFAQACRDGRHLQMEESTPEFDMAQTINAHWSQIDKIRIFLFTDGRSTLTSLENDDLDGISVVYELWDIERIRRLATSGRQEEPITLNMLEFGSPIPCLPATSDDSEYHCLMAVFPGKLLADIYERHGAKLLQRNVRAFLQARGKVNKGINETIRTQPDRFLAYNNGISATVTNVEVEEGPGGPHIVRFHDFQIVNGGQTTASLHHAVRRDDADLRRVQVAAKITVVPPGLLDELVPRISRYANSQNTINEADFESNSPFHIQLEQHSRSVWAPAPAGSTRQTHWYYERVRGQYDVARSRFSATKLRKAFEQDFPKSHKFTKTDAAKYEMTFQQQPHVVSLGAQKCFNAWTLQVLAGADLPTIKRFQDLVAKKIIFDRARREIQLLHPKAGYLANVTTYTVARLLNDLDVDHALELVWRAQAMPEVLLQAVRELCGPVRKVLLAAPGSGNVTEWCKKPECWKLVHDMSWHGVRLS
ncbi:AIPR family protein [Actinomadura sp. 21ATH]|uniref:AIPR family protein n=1 Tax=Actinomadura sp. 21ATH TaxID=1735444 RepID=UPI0035C1C421